MQGDGINKSNFCAQLLLFFLLLSIKNDLIDISFSLNMTHLKLSK
jgi:hypothetical protein